jgi:hypothetical protein
MATQFVEKQLDAVASGREKMARVRVGNNAVVILSEQFFDRVHPILEYMASQPEAGPSNGANEWTEEKNARRAALINKKYDQGLTASEKKELARLQKEASEFRDRVAPVRNEILELLLAGLKQKAAKRSRR